MTHLTFSISDTLKSRGVKVAMAVCSVPQVSKRRGSELEKNIEGVIGSLDIENKLRSPILKAYKVLYPAGIESMPPAEHLLRIVERSKMIPNINKVVDCYNIVSLETLLSIGAHDLAHIKGDIVFKETDGTEQYTPLGKEEVEVVSKDEYACMDEEKILCRMDLKQCNETKVGSETKEFIVYVQGNSETSEEYVKE